MNHVIQLDPPIVTCNDYGDLRQHTLLAFVMSGEVLPSSLDLITAYENRFGLGVPLTDFSGDIHWRKGALQFRLYSPELPELAALASEALPETPIVYFSVDSLGLRSRKRFYLGGVRLSALSDFPQTKVGEFIALFRGTEGVVVPAKTTAK